MKKLTAIPAAILVIVLFTQCHRHHHYGFKTYFWTSSATAENESLYINGKYLGELPLLNETPSDDNGLKQEALFVRLPSGKYRIIVRDEDGDIKFRQTIKLHIGGGDKSITVSDDGDRYRSLRVINKDDIIEEILDK